MESKPVDRRTLTIASRILIFAFVLALIISTVRQGIASYYFRQNLPDALQKAMICDPANPVYPAALANLIHFYGQSPDPDAVIRLYQSAVRLSPFDAGYIADLAQANDWAGHTMSRFHFFSSPSNSSPTHRRSIGSSRIFIFAPVIADDALPPSKKSFPLTSSRKIKSSRLATVPASILQLSSIIFFPATFHSYFAYLNFETQHGNFSAAKKRGIVCFRLIRHSNPRKPFPSWMPSSIS